MKKKILIIAFVLLFAVSSLFSSVSFVFGGLTQHPEILFGFVPSYVMGGAGYSGISFMEDNKTEFQLLLGGGYSQRKLWQDEDTGEVIHTYPIIYDVADFDWSLRLAQGFGDSSKGDKDLLTVTLAYDGQYEYACDSIAYGKLRDNGGVSYVNSRYGYGVGIGYDGDIYPELNGNGQFLGTQLSLSLKLDQMHDDIHTNDGYLAKASIKWGPKALNSALGGYADYLALSADFILAKTLFTLESNEKTMLSIVAIDRLNAGYVVGDAIPAFIQGPSSLGRKVRGFNTYTYNTEFTCVNNLDIRFAGPYIGLDGLAPRVNIFFDCGYGFGNVMNTEVKNNNFLASTGVQATATIFDFIDLGYQLAYLIKGDNYVHGSDSRLVGSVTFFLDF